MLRSYGLIIDLVDFFPAFLLVIQILRLIVLRMNQVVTVTSVVGTSLKTFLTMLLMIMEMIQNEYSLIVYLSICILQY